QFVERGQGDDVHAGPFTVAVGNRAGGVLNRKRMPSARQQRHLSEDSPLHRADRIRLRLSTCPALRLLYRRYHPRTCRIASYSTIASAFARLRLRTLPVGMGISSARSACRASTSGGSPRDSLPNTSASPSR